MSFTLEAAGVGTNASWSSPQTLTLPSAYSTVANDCIILSIATSGTPTVGVSGCGATWVVNQFKVTGGAECTFAVGYACTAGGTTVSVTGLSGLLGDYVIGVFSGVLTTATPIRGFNFATGSVVSTLTTPSETYVLGDLLIGSGFENSTQVWNASTWGNGGTNTNIGSSHSNVGVIADYQVPVSGSTSTYTINMATLSTPGASIAALKPAPSQGNMLLVL